MISTNRPRSWDESRLAMVSLLQGREEPVWASLCPSVLSTFWRQQTISSWPLQWECHSLSRCWAQSIALIGNKVPCLFMSLVKVFPLCYSYLIFSFPLDFILYFWRFKHYLHIWAVEMAQWWRVLDALVEDQGLVSKHTHQGPESPVTQIPGNLVTSDLCWNWMCYVCVCIGIALTIHNKTHNINKTLIDIN